MNEATAERLVWGKSVTPGQFSPQEDREYAIGCVVKQKGLSPADAAAFVDGLPAETRAAVVDAGRHGDVAKVRELLVAD